MSARLPTVLGALLALSGPVLALMSGGLSGAVIALGLAGVVACGGLVGASLGLLGVLAALSHGAAPALPLTAVALGGPLAAGAALGLLVRCLDAGGAWLVGARGAGTVTLLALIVGLLGLVPDEHVRLVDEAGMPRTLDAVVHDPLMGTRIAGEVPAVVAAAPSLEGLAKGSLWIAPLGAWLLLLALALGQERVGRWALAVAGSAVAAAGGAGLAQLLGGPLPLPDAHGLALDLAALTGAGGAVHILDAPTTGHLSLASRPMIDGLRLLGGLALVALALRGLRGAGMGGPAPAVDGAPALSPIALLAATALAILASAALAPSASAWITAAGGLCALAALVGGWLLPRSSRLPWDALTTGIAVIALGWCGALAGWLGAA